MFSKAISIVFCISTFSCMCELSILSLNNKPYAKFVRDSRHPGPKFELETNSKKEFEYQFVHDGTKASFKIPIWNISDNPKFPIFIEKDKPSPEVIPEEFCLANSHKENALSKTVHMSQKILREALSLI